MERRVRNGENANWLAGDDFGCHIGIRQQCPVRVVHLNDTLPNDPCIPARHREWHLPYVTVPYLAWLGVPGYVHRLIHGELPDVRLVDESMDLDFAEIGNPH